MKYITNLSINQKKKNQNIKNYIFREYEKKKDKFVATNKFFISEEVEGGKIEFNGFNINKLYQSKDGYDKIKLNSIKKNTYQKIIPYSEHENIYISINNKSFLENNFIINRYIELILISNISFSLDDININKNEIINKIMENDIIIDDYLFEDLYYNEDFSKKINLELPKKYNDKKIILEDMDIDKKYLFKINIDELNRSFSEENNILVFN